MSSPPLSRAAVVVLRDLDRADGMAIPLSAAALIVLRDLDDADGKEVIRAGMKELVRAGAWQIRTDDGDVLLTPGNGPQPSVIPLPRLSREIEAAADRRSLWAIAGHVRPKAFVSDLLDGLIAAGLMQTKVRRARRDRHVRTAEGDARLAVEAELRVQDSYRSDPDAGIDPAFDAAFDVAFDAGFTPRLGGRKEVGGGGGGWSVFVWGGDDGDGGGGDGGGSGEAC